MVRSFRGETAVKRTPPLTSAENSPLEVPRELPFLASLSWSDRAYRELPPADMLRRYEAGWRHLGVLADPSPEERTFIRALVARFGSYLDVRALDVQAPDA
jgi:hypothetical protein